MGWDISIQDAMSISNWMVSSYQSVGTALGSTSDAAQTVSELGSDFQGQTADAVKNYWGQVHGCMASALGAALTQLSTSYAEYYRELGGIDSDPYARFVQDEIQSAAKKASDISPSFTDVDGGVKTTLGDIADIISLSAPDVSAVTDQLSTITKDADALESDVNDTETSGSTKAASAGELISSAEAFLAQIESGTGGGGMSYVPADFFTTQAASDLLDRLDEFSKSNYANGDYVSQQMGSMCDDMQARFEEAKKEAEQQSVLKIVAGVGVILAGAACIVATAGTAAPAVVVAGAAVLGGATATCGVADVVEGGQDAYKSFNANDWSDLNTKSFNFVRDTVFGGNEEAYRNVENGLVVACSLAAPVAEGTSAFAVARAAGGTFGRAALSGAGAATRSYAASQAMGVVDAHVVNPVLSNLAGGGITGDLVVGLKDVAMGAYGLRGGGSKETEAGEGSGHTSVSGEPGESRLTPSGTTTGMKKTPMGEHPESGASSSTEHFRVSSTSGEAFHGAHSSAPETTSGVPRGASTSEAKTAAGRPTVSSGSEPHGGSMSRSRGSEPHGKPASHSSGGSSNVSKIVAEQNRNAEGISNAGHMSVKSGSGKASSSVPESMPTKTAGASPASSSGSTPAMGDEHFARGGAVSVVTGSGEGVKTSGSQSSDKHVNAQKQSGKSSGLPSGYNQVNTSVNVVNLPKDTWKAKTPFKRGDIIDEALHNNTGHNYPTVDHFDKSTGVATSVKSIDTSAKSYQGCSGLHSRLKSYIKDVASFNGSDKYELPDGSKIRPNMVKGRRLQVVLPDRPLTPQQIEALNAAKADADKIGVKFDLTIGK